MSNENKKAWINLIIPLIFILIIFYAPRPDVLDNLFGLIMLLVIVMVLQTYLNKFLDKKFPKKEDLKD